MSTRSFRIAQSQATECPQITVRQKTHPRHLKTIKKLTCDPTWSSQAAQEAPGVSPNKEIDHKIIKDLDFFMQAVQIYMMNHRNASEALECDKAVDSESHHFDASMSPETQCE